MLKIGIAIAGFVLALTVLFLLGQIKRKLDTMPDEAEVGREPYIVKRLKVVGALSCIIVAILITQIVLHCIELFALVGGN